MWPGSSRRDGSAGLRSKPSGAVLASRTCRPGTTTEDRPCGARGRGLRDVSVVIQFSWLLRVGTGSAADAETLPDRTVTGDVLLGQVLQQPAAAADQQQQPAAAVVVMLVHLEVLGQVVDPPGQQRNLDFRRTGVTLTGRILRQDFLLGGGVERHVAPQSLGLARNGLRWLIPRFGSRQPH